MNEWTLDGPLFASRGAVAAKVEPMTMTEVYLELTQREIDEALMHALRELGDRFKPA